MNINNIFIGNTKQYAEWLKDNLSEISSMCDWGELVSTPKIEIYAGDGNEVARITMLHTDNYVSELLCELFKRKFQFEAFFYDIFGVESYLKTGHLRNDA